MDETKPRNTRMSDQEWDALEERARAERMATGENITRADIVRKAINLYLKTKIKPSEAN